MVPLMAVWEVHLFKPGNDLLWVPEPDEPRLQLLKYGIAHFMHVRHHHCLLFTELVGLGMQVVGVYQLPNHVSFNGYRALNPDVIALQQAP